MRGTLGFTPVLPRILGIIPAYAGNTVPAAAADSRHRDHPRVCGEHAHFGSLKIRFPGSSPRMRGTRAIRAVHIPEPGIIPAYAGNT